MDQSKQINREEWHAIVVDYESPQCSVFLFDGVWDGSQVKSQLPDFSNLLFLSPSVKANNTVSFYTSDRAGDYIGVVQGITANGEAGCKYFRFSVKK